MTIVTRCLIHGIPQGAANCELNNIEGWVVGKGADGRLWVKFGDPYANGLSTFAVNPENVALETQRVQIGPDAAVVYQQYGTHTRGTVEVSGQVVGFFEWHRGLVLMGRHRTPVSSIGAAVQSLLDAYRKAQDARAAMARAFGVVA